MLVRIGDHGLSYLWERLEGSPHQPRSQLPQGGRARLATPTIQMRNQGSGTWRLPEKTVWDVAGPAFASRPVLGSTSSPSVARWVSSFPASARSLFFTVSYSPLTYLFHCCLSTESRTVGRKPIRTIWAVWLAPLLALWMTSGLASDLSEGVRKYFQCHVFLSGTDTPHRLARIIK